MGNWVTLEFDIVGLDVVILGKTHVPGTEFEKQGQGLRKKNLEANQPKSYYFYL